MQQLITRARNWLRRKPRPTRVVITTLVPTGFILIGLGLWLDTIDWWPRHNYLLNLVSGLTGACFGVPFALVGLDYLTRTQAEYREAERDHARAAAAVDSFVASLLDPFNGRDLDDVAGRVEDLSDQIAVIRFMRPEDPVRADALADFFAAFEVLFSVRMRVGDGFTSLSRNSAEVQRMRLWRTGVTTQWKRLDDGARDQLNGGWIDKVTETAGHQAVEQLLESGRSPWRRSPDPERNGVAAMRYFLSDLKALCEAAQAMEALTR